MEIDFVSMSVSELKDYIITNKEILTDEEKEILSQLEIEVDKKE